MVQLLVSIVLCFMSNPAAADWMADQAAHSRSYLLKNISPSGTAPGAVVASPSRSNPDYFYHWVRDAALVMNAVVSLYENETDAARKNEYEETLTNFIRFSAMNQTTANRSDKLSSGRLGEPKFLVNGADFAGDWGRPQNDGPALRAITLIRLANLWLDAGRKQDVVPTLYSPELPALSPIKRDLEFVAYNWEKTSFDIWEEIIGQHFYTRLVHHRALREGAKLAQRLGDTNAASFYEEQLSYVSGSRRRTDLPAGFPNLGTLVASHWQQGLLVPTFDRDGGIDYKYRNIDTAVLLAVLHARGEDGFYAASDSRVLATLERQIAEFQALYPVNHKGYGATVLGRYPEDTYNGLESGKEGNPWFLTTAAVAEIHFRAAREIEAAHSFAADAHNEMFLQAVGVKPLAVYQGQDKDELVRKIRLRGDAFLARACFHGLADGHLSEQINRHTGFMQGAPDLTWSYASFLTAYWQR